MGFGYNLFLLPTVSKFWKSVRFSQNYHHQLGDPLLRRLRLSSIASSMTLWSIPCQASSKRFFSSSMLCSCDWCTCCWMSPYILQSTGLRSVLFDGHRSGEMKAGVDCSRNCTMSRARCAGRCTVCLVERRRNRLTRQASWATAAATKHVAIIADVDFHSQLNKDEVRPDTITDRPYVDLVRNLSQIWTANFHRWCGNIL